MKENLPHLKFTVVVGKGEGENMVFDDLLKKGYGRPSLLLKSVLQDDWPC